MNAPPDPVGETQTPSSPPTSDVKEPSPAPAARKLWYGSTWLLIMYSALLMIVFCIIGFIPYSKTFMEAVQKTFQLSSLHSTSTEIASPLASPTPHAADAQSACVIVWAQHQPDNLGKKSRARVWEQIISNQVKAAGMTPQQFYDLVVQYNPQLIQDDYEFKKGKTYLLPECR